MANRSYTSNLFLNVKHLCAVRNIPNPYTYLYKNGFTQGIASRLATNNIIEVNVAHIEKLCILFNCTPNDLFDYKPTQPVEQLKNNPLVPLMKTQKPVNFNELLRTMPIDKLKEIEEEIRKRKS